MSPIRRTLVALAAAALLAGCRDGPTAPGDGSLPRPLTQAEAQLVGASNTFAFGLLHEVSAATPADSSIFLSPLSASMALGMTMNGAAGSTLDGMRHALALDGMSLQDADASYRSLIDLLRSVDPRVDFRIANSIWYANGLSVLPSFLSTTHQYFDAEVAAKDFRDPATPDAINAWVSRSTNGKITRIVNTIPPEMVMYLLNAIYFKGSWHFRFDASETHAGPFTLGDGGSTSATLMHAEMTVPFYADSTLVAGELPYGNGAFAMVVLVPTGQTTAESLVQGLDADRWATILQQMEERPVDVVLPRFTLDWERRLNDPLIALGMAEAFDDRADFSAMATGQSLVISEVKQKTYVDVNEEGTEAAAVTSVGVGVTSVGEAPSLHATRPFVFAIRERSSGAILFIGKLARPPAQ